MKLDVLFTRSGPEMHTSISERVFVGQCDTLSPAWHQVNTLTNADVSIGDKLN